MTFNTILKKIARAWYSDYKIGKIKEVYFRHLWHKYKFHEWHVSPINFRPYGIGIINYLNKQKKKKVVEIGCGLGEIIGNIMDCEREAFDIDINVIKAAKRLYHNTNFKVGTFENVKKQEIDYLITVNFIHGIPSDELKDKFRILCTNNDIKQIVLDITDSTEYMYIHDINFLFDGLGYKIKKKLHRYEVKNGTRWIYILEKG